MIGGLEDWGYRIDWIRLDGKIGIDKTLLGSGRNFVEIDWR